MLFTCRHVKKRLICIHLRNRGLRSLSWQKEANNENKRKRFFGEKRSEMNLAAFSSSKPKAIHQSMNNFQTLKNLACVCMGRTVPQLLW